MSDLTDKEILELRDFPGVALFEVVDGQLRIVRLEDEKDTRSDPPHSGANQPQSG